MLLGPLMRQRGVRILTYHSVGKRNHDMNVSPERFREQMEWLARNAEVIPLSAVLERQEGDEPEQTLRQLPLITSTTAADTAPFESKIQNPKSKIKGACRVAITFDDGYRDNLLNAAPILHALELSATVFIVAGRVGGTLDHDDTGDGVDALMTWQDIEQWIALGLDVGCHSMTHRRLSQLSEDEQRSEIVDSLRLLRERTGHQIGAFAYPFGSAYDYDAISVRLVCEAGFACGLSNRYGVNGRRCDRWAMRRIWIDSTDDMRTFQAKVDGRLDILSILDSPAGLACRRALNLTLRVR
jgi:peptidoglycan/xylan/chitin deacetylase (PgdA/CDA1 family)